MTTGYRVHPAGEPIETCLDARRADGWVAEGDRQLPGVACCASISALARYVRQYGMDVRPGDVVVEVSGHMAATGGMDGLAELRIEGHSVSLVGPAAEVLEGALCPAGCEDRMGDVVIMDEDHRGDLECPRCGATRTA